MNKDPESSQKAQARWAMLRNALLHNGGTTKAENNPAISSNHNNNNNINNNLSSDDVNKYSIHRFEGFQIFNRVLIADERVNGDTGSISPNCNGYEIIEYAIPIVTIGTEDKNSSQSKDVSDHECQQKHQHRIIKVRTREPTKHFQRKVNIKDLMSHVHYGVDNTGNTRVWDCSSILAHLVACHISSVKPLEPIDPTPCIGLSNILSLAQSIPIRSDLNHDHNNIASKRLRIIELGAGMAALPSLSLAALALSDSTIATMPFMDIYITDGHPKSVENNLVCSKLTCELYNTITSDLDSGGNGNGMNNVVHSSNLCSIQCHQLLWKANNQGYEECQSLLKCGQDDDNSIDYFDLILVSDCTHFTECHAGLITTIGRLLRVNGVCLLCQPKRGKTLDQFMDMVRAIDNRNQIDHHVIGPLFALNLYRDYDEKISNQHKMHSERNDRCYDENIHRPILLELRKVRDFNEEIDTMLATRHLGEREKKPE